MWKHFLLWGATDRFCTWDSWTQTKIYISQESHGRRNECILCHGWTMESWWALSRPFSIQPSSWPLGIPINLHEERFEFGPLSRTKVRTPLKGTEHAKRERKPTQEFNMICNQANRLNGEAYASVGVRQEADERALRDGWGCRAGISQCSLSSLHCYFAKLEQTHIVIVNILPDRLYRKFYDILLLTSLFT